MAKTSRDMATPRGRHTSAAKSAARSTKKRTLNAEREKTVGLQAPTGSWSPASLLAALKRGTVDEKVAVLKKAGILDASGKLTETYRSWGSKVTRTPNAEQVRV